MLVQVNLACLINEYDCYSLKLMATGVAGSNGLAAQRHVDLEIGAGQETVTTQPQPLEAETAREQVLNLELVTQTLVQVNPECLFNL